MGDLNGEMMMTTITDSQVTPIALGAMGKVFLVQGDAGAILVDAGMPGQAGQILDALAAHGVKPEVIRLILITHGHVDHIGSARELRERTGAPVAIHMGDAAALRGEEDLTESAVPTSRLFGMLMRLGARLAPSGPDSALEPDIIFDAAWRLDEYGVAGEVIPTPGHSPGSVSLLLDNGEAIVGDLVMGSMLFPKRAIPPRIAWDLDLNWASLRAVLDRQPKIVYITHGQAYAPEVLRQLLIKYA
jgi:hydroxyacylglutathione hydrolase